MDSQTRYNASESLRFISNKAQQLSQLLANSGERPLTAKESAELERGIDAIRRVLAETNIAVSR